LRAAAVPQQEKTHRRDFLVELVQRRAILISGGGRMSGDADDLDELLRRAGGGDQAALGALFDRHRDRLRRMVQVRMDRRLQGRLDASDVLQEAFLEVARCLDDYRRNPALPFFLWLRVLTGRKLLALHRHHLGTHMRAAGREVSLRGGALPQASSASLAAQLLGRQATPSQEAVRAELQGRIEAVLNGMDDLDREILALRHFEQLSNAEAAQVLGISQAAASNRFIRALKRLRAILAAMPGVADTAGGAV
jgi:RNA polymerase sigma-70 factor (ECF subfamily)